MSLLTVPAWVMGGGVPAGPLQLPRNGCWATCSALASKAVAWPQGWADKSPWCFRTGSGRAPRSALQPAWHKWCRNLSRPFLFCFFFFVPFFDICWSWFFHKEIAYLFCKRLEFFAFFLKIILFSLTQQEGHLGHGGTSCRLGLLWQFNRLKAEAALACC